MEWVLVWGGEEGGVHKPTKTHYVKTEVAISNIAMG